MNKFIRVVEVTPLEDYYCKLVFDDGTQKVLNLKPFLHGPIFEPILKDINVFRSAHVVDGTIGWKNGADIDPDVLYYDLKPAWMEEPINR